MTRFLRRLGEALGRAQLEFHTAGARQPARAERRHPQ